MGQVYVRSMEVRGVRAVMDSWYFPKYSSKDGFTGHRRDWEETFRFFDRKFLLAPCCPKYGDYRKGDASKFESPNPIVELFWGRWSWSTSELKFHYGGLVSKKQPPLIQWESMVPAAIRALNNADFGRATCSLVGRSFANKVNEGVQQGIWLK